jgi:hypothetical protein
MNAPIKDKSALKSRADLLKKRCRTDATLHNQLLSHYTHPMDSPPKRERR